MKITGYKLFPASVQRPSKDITTITVVSWAIVQQMTLVCNVCLSIFFIIGCASTKANQSKSGYPIAGKAWNLPLPGNAMLNMLWVAPGTFTMGSPLSETGRKADEGPQAEVTLTRGYWLGRTELTIGQWKAVTGESLREHVIKMLNDET